MDHDRDKIRELTERIQVGDADEGAEALQEIIDTAVEQANARQANDRGAMREAMREEMVSARRKVENDAALEKFGKRFPQLKDDTILVDGVKGIVRHELIEDLKKTGAVPEADLARIERVEDLAALHGHARAQGHQVRSPDEVLARTGQEITRRGWARPAQRSPQEYVRDMRIARGLPVREERVEPARAANYGRAAPRSDEETMARNQEWVRKSREARGYDRRSDR